MNWFRKMAPGVRNVAEERRLPDGELHPDIDRHFEGGHSMAYPWPKLQSDGGHVGAKTNPPRIMPPSESRLPADRMAAIVARNAGLRGGKPVIVAPAKREPLHLPSALAVAHEVNRLRSLNGTAPPMPVSSEGIANAAYVLSAIANLAAKGESND